MSRLLLTVILCSPALVAAQEILVCYDELGRKSTILTFNLATERVTVEESGDEFVCAADFKKYCTTSEGTLEQTPTLLTFSWVRELSGERTVYEVNTDNLTYIGQYAGGIWEGQCEFGKR